VKNVFNISHRPNFNSKKQRFRDWDPFLSSGKASHSGPVDSVLVDWPQQSRLYMSMETDSNLINVVFFN
jgi:hypothetical protein